VGNMYVESGRGYDLKGAIDLHVHGAPDLTPRLLDDLELARQAEQAGMQAIVLKNHLFSTVGRAWLVDRLVSGVRVLGGVVLNQGATGGLNVEAVRANLALGAQVIWMPTMMPRDDRAMPCVESGQQYTGLVSSTDVELGDRETARCVRTILRAIAEAGAVLATGHLVPATTRALVDLAVQQGVTKILVTHPDSPIVQMPVPEQVALSRLGVYFERCAYSIVDDRYGVPVADISAAIRATGIEHNVISSDLGQVGNPAPVEGLSIFCDALAQEGFEEEELTVMTENNPRALLGSATLVSTRTEAD
jgi:hypothetical protein